MLVKLGETWVEHTKVESINPIHKPPSIKVKLDRENHVWPCDAGEECKIADAMANAVNDAYREN